MSRAAHWDVAAYALGVLDEREAERFEEHLAGCWACAGELESMLPVVNLLSEVDGENLATAEQSRSEGRVLDRMIVEVGAHRRRARTRQILAAAASVAVLATASGVAFYAGGLGGNETGGNVSAQNTNPGATGPATTNPGSGGPGIGGPGGLSEDGERFPVEDGDTGVKIELVLETKIWGTQIGYMLTNLTGPRTCRLVVIRESGSTEVLNTWTVPPSGYGTKDEPQPLLLQTSTATPRNDIDRIQVQSISDEGVAQPLVTVPV
ncbi:zf-HC2 domain-containing protein [Actinomycetes bacterium KLBMP 9797]